MQHIPKRMCVSCRQMKPKKELIKLVRTDTGAIFDENQNMFGRGAYICKNETCIKDAKRKKTFSRHFKMKLDDCLYDNLLKNVIKVQRNG